MAFTDKIGNCPFASLIACVVVFVGVGVFCGTLYRALAIILKSVMEDLFLFKVSWLEALQIVFIVIAAVMALYALLLVVFGFLATGATRRNVYSGTNCIMGGRISAAFNVDGMFYVIPYLGWLGTAAVTFMFVSYILNLGWMFIMSLMVVPVIVYLMVRSICNTEIYSRDANSIENYCFSLTNFGIYRNQTYYGVSSPGKEALCGYTELSRFCDRVFEAGPLFCVAYVGAALICIGMLHFMVSLSANYTRIRISKELTDYRDAVDMEELDLHSSDKGSTQY